MAPQYVTDDIDRVHVVLMFCGLQATIVKLFFPFGQVFELFMFDFHTITPLLLHFRWHWQRRGKNFK